MKLLTLAQIQAKIESGNTAEITRSTGLSFPTVKAAQRGQLTNPTIKTLVALSQYANSKK